MEYLCHLCFGVDGHLRKDHGKQNKMRQSHANLAMECRLGFATLYPTYTMPLFRRLAQSVAKPNI
jgi:hypothetical protein